MLNTDEHNRGLFLLNCFCLQGKHGNIVIFYYGGRFHLYNIKDVFIILVEFLSIYKILIKYKLEMNSACLI